MTARLMMRARVSIYDVDDVFYLNIFPSVLHLLTHFLLLCSNVEPAAFLSFIRSTRRPRHPSPVGASLR